MEYIIITGCNSGIGYEASKKFVNEGNFVLGIDINDNNIKKDLIEKENFKFINYDLSNIDNFNLLFDKIMSIDKKFNILINCAGVREICNSLDLSIEEWTKVININLTATFLLSQYFAKQIDLNNINNNIINISSVSGLMAEPNRAAYVSSKHAIIGLTKEMAIDLSEYNIRVNSIAPGVVKTDMTAKYFDNKEQTDIINKAHLLNRVALPEEIVDVIYFLSSKKASFITGSTIVVDGGWSAGKII